MGGALLSCCVPDVQPRWRAVGHDIYRTVGGYVTGNLLISFDRRDAYNGRRALASPACRSRSRSA